MGACSHIRSAPRSVSSARLLSVGWLLFGSSAHSRQSGKARDRRTICRCDISSSHAAASRGSHSHSGIPHASEENLRTNVNSLTWVLAGNSADPTVPAQNQVATVHRGRLPLLMVRHIQIHLHSVRFVATDLSKHSHPHVAYSVRMH